MGSDGQGTIYIPLAEFWEFVAKYAPDCQDGEVVYGIPRITSSGGDLEIDYAFSTECNPKDWTEKPPAVTQWKDKP